MVDAGPGSEEIPGRTKLWLKIRIQCPSALSLFRTASYTLLEHRRFGGMYEKLAASRGSEQFSMEE